MLLYFRFLRWLLAVNVVISALVFIFTVVPQIAFPDSTTMPSSNTTVNDFRSRNIAIAATCSRLYVVKEPRNADRWQPVIDFLQGTVSVTRNKKQ